jgi:hypothetical protein
MAYTGFGPGKIEELQLQTIGNAGLEICGIRNL